MLLSHDNLEKDYRREDDNISKLIKWPSSHVVKMIYFEGPPQTTFHKIAIFSINTRCWNYQGSVLSALHEEDTSRPQQVAAKRVALPEQPDELDDVRMGKVFNGLCVRTRSSKRMAARRLASSDVRLDGW